MRSRFFLFLILGVLPAALSARSVSLLSSATDPLIDAKNTWAPCFVSMGKLLSAKYDGEGFLILPPRTEKDGFILRLIQENEDVNRSPSLMRALKNPYIIGSLRRLKFNYVHSRSDIPRTEFVGYDADGSPVDKVVGHIRREQKIYEIPDLATLRFHMRLFESKSLHRFEFVPREVSGGVLTHLTWLKALAAGTFPVSNQGDAFQHDYHDHILAFIFLPPRLARALKASLSFLLSVYEDTSLAPLVHQTAWAYLEKMAYRIEEASALLQSEISRLQRHRFSPWKRRAQRERIAEIFRYFAMLDWGRGELSAKRWSEIISQDVSSSANYFALNPSTHSLKPADIPDTFFESEIENASRALEALLFQSL